MPEETGVPPEQFPEDVGRAVDRAVRRSRTRHGQKEDPVDGRRRPGPALKEVPNVQLTLSMEAEVMVELVRFQNRHGIGNRSGLIAVMVADLLNPKNRSYRERVLRLYQDREEARRKPVTADAS